MTTVNIGWSNVFGVTLVASFNISEAERSSIQLNVIIGAKNQITHFVGARLCLIVIVAGSCQRGPPR